MGKETALPKNIRQIGEIQGEEKICLEDYVMTYIRKKEKQEKEGYLGVFLGEEQKTDDAVYVFIRGILEIPESDKEEEQILDGLKEKYQNYFPDWEVQGCCVIGRYPTDRMKEVCTLIPQAGRLIYHLQEQEENLYWTEEGRYKKMKGYFVFYEQNRKMQAYLADVFREDSVEKESLPDKAIKTFREKVRAKSERKSSSMLKMASSFFVITVLVIGAVVVTRMDDIRDLRNAVNQQENTVENEADDEKAQVSASAATAEQVRQENQAAGAAIKEAAGTDTETAVNGADAGTDTGAVVKEAAVGTDTGTAVNGAIAGTDTGTATNGAIAGTDTGTAANGAIAGTDTEAAANGAIAGTDTGTAANGAIAGSDTGTAENEVTAGSEGKDAAGGANASSETGANAVSGSTAAGTDTADAAATASGAAASAKAETLQSDETQEVSAAARQTRAAYVIREGDTLADICNRYYGSLERIQDICTANGITDANMILPGQKIVLP